MDPRDWPLCTRAVLLTVIFALGSVGAVAQPTVSVRGNVGASFFRSPELQRETLHSGEAFGLEAGVRVYRGLAITLQGGYDRFTVNKETAQLINSRFRAGDLLFLNGSAGVRYTYVTESDAHPYISTAVGVYRLRSPNWKEYDSGEVVGDKELNVRRLGAHLGVGSLFRLDDTFAVVFEPRYVFFDLRQGLTDAVRYFTLRLGVDVQF